MVQADCLWSAPLRSSCPAAATLQSQPVAAAAGCQRAGGHAAALAASGAVTLDGLHALPQRVRAPSATVLACQRSHIIL